MRLTTLSDYTLRFLMYTAAHDRLVTIEEVSDAFGISRAHLMKVANLLTRAGYLQAVRGRGGGLTLAVAPSEVRLGAVLRITEPDFALVECFATGNECTISQRCRLPKILNTALTNFLATFDEFTLADVVLREKYFEEWASPSQTPRGPNVPAVPARRISVR